MLNPPNLVVAEQPLTALPNISPMDLPFVWGGGGQRLTPDDIERQRKMAEAQAQAGMDYSPVGSWTQGLARVAQGLLGAFDERKLDKASAANDAEEKDVVAKLLTNGGAGTAPLAALANPNLSAGTQSIAKLLYERNNPAAKQPNETQQLLIDSGLTPGSPAYQAAAAKLLERKGDPFITTSLPGGGFYGGPQSDLMRILGGGGQPSVAPAGTPPATLPPDFDFGASPTGNMGIPPNAVSPGGSTPTVLSRVDAAPFIKSLGPEGFQRWMTSRNIRLGN